MTAPGMPVVRRPRGEVLRQVLVALETFGEQGGLLQDVARTVGLGGNLAGALLRSYLHRGYLSRVELQRGHTRYFFRPEWAQAWADRATTPPLEVALPRVPAVDQVLRLMHALGVTLQDLMTPTEAARFAVPRQLVTLAAPPAPKPPRPSKVAKAPKAPKAPKEPKPHKEPKPKKEKVPRTAVLRDVVRHAQAPLRPVPTRPNANTTAIQAPKAPKQGLARDVVATNPNGVVPFVCPAGRDTRYQVTPADLARLDSLGAVAEWRRRTGQA